MSKVNNVDSEKIKKITINLPILKKSCIGKINLTPEFTDSIISIMSSIEKDSSLDYNVLFFIVEDHKLSISRKNRYSELIINYHFPFECSDMKVPIIFDDFVRIFKFIKEDSLLTFYNDKMTIDTDICQYSIQNYNFEYTPFHIQNPVEIESRFLIPNSVIKEIYSSIVITPLKRIPSILDSIFIHDGLAYCLDHSLLSRYELAVDNLKNINFTKPIPLFLFRVANNMSDDCSVEFHPYNSYIIASFNIEKIAHVKVISSYLAGGQYPFEKINTIFADLGGYQSSNFSTDKKDFIKLTKRLTSISDNSGLVLCDVEIEKENMNFLLFSHDKSIRASLSIEDSKLHTSNINKFTVAINNINKALKYMDDKICISITEKFLILYDSKLMHIIPLTI